MVLDAALLYIKHYKVRIKGKVEQSRERSTALSYTLCSSYQKGSLRVALDYGCQLYLLNTNTSTEVLILILMLWFKY